MRNHDPHSVANGGLGLADNTSNWAIDNAASRLHTSRSFWRMDKPDALAQLVIHGETWTHSGEWFQVPIYDRDEITTALLTFSNWFLKPRTTIRIRPTPHQPGIRFVLVPAHYAKARRALEIFINENLQLIQRRLFERLGTPDVTMYVEVDIPFREKAGWGSSTASCHCPIYTINAGLNLAVPDTKIASAIYRAEGPSDPLAFLKWGEVAVVWGSRVGRILKVIPKALPAAHALVAIPNITEESGIDTNRLAAKTIYRPRDVIEGASIMKASIEAIDSGDLRSLARAAAASLEGNQKRCRTPHLNAVRRIARKYGALGYAGSHSGSSVQLIFSPAGENLCARIAAAKTAMVEAGFEEESMHDYRVS